MPISHPRDRRGECGRGHSELRRETCELTEFGFSVDERAQGCEAAFESAAGVFGGEVVGGVRHLGAGPHEVEGVVGVGG